MGLLRVCSAAGCSTRTLGEFCIQHEGTTPAGDLYESLLPTATEQQASSDPSFEQPAVAD